MAIDLSSHLSDRYEITLLLINNIIEHSTPAQTPLKIKHIQGNQSYKIFWPWIIYKLLIEIRKNDIIIAGMELSTTYLTWLASSLAGKPYIPIVHNVLSKHIATSSRLKRVNFFLSRVVYWKCLLIISVSNTVAMDLCNQFGVSRNNIATIYNPIDIDRIRRLSLLKHDITVDDFIIAVGGLRKQKGFDVLIRALSLIHPDIRPSLLIIGQGPEYNNLKQLIDRYRLRNWIYLSGFMDNPYNLMSHAKLFILPSRYEGFPLVILEAMSCNVPILASDIPSIREACTDRGAIYFEPDNIEALKKGIINILANDDLRADLIQSGQNRVGEFALPAIARQYDTLFQKLLGSDHE